MSNGREGTNHWQNKLTEEDVRWIRRNYNPTKMSKTSLAQKYGVQLSTISRILTGESWKHVKVTNIYSREIRQITERLGKQTKYPLEVMDVL